MKVLSENCTARRITKQFEIELDNGSIVHVTKWTDYLELPSGSDYDGDWEFDSEKDKAIYEALDQDAKDEFDEFVVDLDL